MMKEKITWKIHMVTNGNCSICGEKEENILLGMGNIHTHGLDRYNHPELQIVVDLGPELIGYILNTVGLRIAAGKRIIPGKDIDDIVSDPKGNSIAIRTVLTEEGFVRLLIPDPNFLYPGEKGCTYPYSLQQLPTTAIASEIEQKEC